MKNELRGKRTKDYNLGEIINIEKFYCDYSNKNIKEERIGEFSNQYCVNITSIHTYDQLREEIRTTIISLYNEDISPAYMFIHDFICWYKDCAKALDRRLDNNKIQLLNFEEVLNADVINNTKDYLIKEYNKAIISDYIKHLQVKLISYVKKKIVTDRENYFTLIDSIIRTTLSNCLFLNLINSKGEVDSYFLLQWEYYPVDKLFRDIINTLNSEVSKTAYEELRGNEYRYFDMIKKANVDFSSIKSIKIKKEEKIRKVFMANEPIDQVTLLYLSKKLNHEFDVKYPDRDKIMELCFNLIDSLPRLDDYTIFKFDFKDFFDSVEIKNIYKGFIEHSGLCSSEKELILKLERKYTYCVQGLPISNVLIEIISREFDERLKAAFAEGGLIFYKRYVDDCIMIFNHKEEKDRIEKFIDTCRKDIFGRKVLFSSTKTTFQTKYSGDASFDYLGYSFSRCLCSNRNPEKSFTYFKFGIAEKKIDKYRKQLDKIFSAFELDGNERILLRRLQYYNARVVFYNYSGSKYVNKNTWDVRGIINTYRMLRRYIIYDNEKRDRENGYTGRGARQVNNSFYKMPYRIEESTYTFLRHYVRNKRNSLSMIPQFLQGKGTDNHSLWSGFLHNKSIVFQPNIGWSNEYLSKRLLELGVSPKHKSYYEKTKDYYTVLMKKL